MLRRNATRFCPSASRRGGGRGADRAPRLRPADLPAARRPRCPLTLLWRRRHPRVVLALNMAAWVVIDIEQPAQRGPARAGDHPRDRRLLGGRPHVRPARRGRRLRSSPPLAVAGTIGDANEGTLLDYLGNAIFFFAIFGGLWLAGRAIRRRRAAGTRADRRARRGCPRRRRRGARPDRPRAARRRRARDQRDRAPGAGRAARRRRRARRGPRRDRVDRREGARRDAPAAADSPR